MDDDQQFCLRWNNHQTTLISVFDTLLEKGMHVDCSLAAEGKTLKAHKVVLSACSPYFENVLSQQYDKHPIIILKDVKYAELRAMMDYMYRGEVNISQDQLAALLKAAESLQIKGLSDNKPPRPSSPSVKSKITESVSTLQSRESSSSPVPRKRKKPRRTSTDVLNHNHNEPLPTTAAPQTQTHTPLALPLPHPVPLAIPIAIPPSTPVIKPATEPINLNLENNIVPPTSKLKMSDIMNNITKNNKVDNNNMELGVAKLEFGSEGPEESVEDLTLDEEGEAEGEGGEEEEAGSSKYGDIVQNFQCYMERSQDEAALSGQDGPRDSQGGGASGGDMSFTYIGGLSWEQWSARLALPLVRGQASPAHDTNGQAPGSFGCSDCSRTYKLKSSLRNHQKWECGKEPQFQCPYCVYRAKQKMHIARHMERMHREKVYVKPEPPLNMDNLNACM